MGRRTRPGRPVQRAVPHPRGHLAQRGGGAGCRAGGPVHHLHRRAPPRRPEPAVHRDRLRRTRGARRTRPHRGGPDAPRASLRARRRRQARPRARRHRHPRTRHVHGRRRDQGRRRHGRQPAPVPVARGCPGDAVRPGRRGAAGPAYGVAASIRGARLHRRPGGEVVGDVSARHPQRERRRGRSGRRRQPRRGRRAHRDVALPRGVHHGGGARADDPRSPAEDDRPARHVPCAADVRLDRDHRAHRLRAHDGEGEGDRDAEAHRRSELRHRAHDHGAVAVPHRVRLRLRLRRAPREPGPLPAHPGAASVRHADDLRDHAGRGRARELRRDLSVGSRACSTSTSTRYRWR